MRPGAQHSLLILVLGVWSFAGHPLHAATLTPPLPVPARTAPASPQSTQPSAPPAEPQSELPKIVAKLAAQPVLSAADCAALAQETITYAQAERQSGKPSKPGVINDGLAAVDRGEAADAKAADWPQLRAKLQDLLKPPPPQDKPKEDEKKQDDKKEEKKDQDQKSKDQQQDQQKSQDQNQEQKPPEQQQQSEQQKQEQEKKQQQAQPQQPDKSEPPKDTQSVGGEKPKDDERKEHPELAVPLQKLDQVRDKDSPAELFQLLHNDEPPPAGQPKKNW